MFIADVVLPGKTLSGVKLVFLANLPDYQARPQYFPSFTSRDPNLQGINCVVEVRIPNWGGISSWSHDYIVNVNHETNGSGTWYWLLPIF
jgi:hypothetical protein